jgi:NIMA (never in mitosis gene a)-related kinase
MSLNDFKMGKQLGKGAFGSVFIVTRLADQKTYAMKQVKISSLNHKERENALNEIRILASLEHPNIVGYKEAFYDQKTKTINIVMEFADDGDLDGKLKKVIQSHRMFEENQIWNWIIQLLEGLKFLHSNKIIHRDLKCANLFLMKNGLLKIGDLNVSKLNKGKYAQTQTGTPYYCAPEIWEDKPYDYKCDIWSVGCILYEICTHHPPFRGTNFKELYNNVKKGYYEPISYSYSIDLKNFIAKFLIVDSRKRPNIDDLLNMEIIKKKISELKNNIINKVVESSKNPNAHANFIKTIKLPKNLNDINRALPKKRYKNNIEREMMENDEFETKKAGFFKEAMNQMNQMNQMNNNNNFNNNNYNNNNYNNNNYYEANNANNNQPINNFNKNLLNKNNNIINNNNYNNNIIDSHKSKDSNPIKINNNINNSNKYSNQKEKEEEKKREEERRKRDEQRRKEYLKLQQQQQQQQQQKHINNNLINYNGNAEYIKNKNMERPASSKPSTNNNSHHHNNNSNNNNSNNNNSNNNNSNNNQHQKIPSTRQERYKYLFGDQPPSQPHHHHHQNPPSNNINKNNNIINSNKNRPQSGRQNNLVNNNNYNYNNKYINNYNNNNKVYINKKKPKAIIEKMDYNKYKQNKNNNNQHLYGFNYNKYNPNMKVNDKYNLQRAMGVGDKNHIARKGPKIVNIKK